MSTSVSGLTTNFFPKPQNGFTTTTSGSVASGAGTVGLNSVAGYANGDIATLVIDPTDASKKQTFTGVIDTSGVQLTSVKWTAGTNQTHALGATVVDYATATHIAQMSKGILVEHNQSGNHTAITATSVAATGVINASSVSSLQDASIALSTYRSDSTFDFVQSGLVWSGDAYASTRVASMTSGVVYINGQRGAISAVTSRTFTASKDTYVDILNTSGVFTVVYTEVTNNAASPALAANSLRVGVVVTGASNIAAAASINQGQVGALLPIASSQPYECTDSLGNLINPRDPNRKVLGRRQIITGAPSNAAWTTSDTDLTGLSVPVIVPTGRSIRVTFTFDFWFTGTSASTSYTAFKIRESTTVLATASSTVGAVANTVNPTGPVTCELTPTAGLHTYKASYANSTTGPLFTLNASTTSPATIKVELI